MHERTREEYETFYLSSGETYLYAAPWWLDAACGPEQWDIHAFQDEYGNNIGFLPYHNAVIRGMKAIINPPLTQWLPVLKATPSAQIQIEKFLEAISGYSILDISLKHEHGRSVTSRGFRVNFKYSFIIPPCKNINEVKSKYNEGLRRNLKEADQKYTVTETDDIKTFLQLCVSTYQQRNIKVPAWVESKVPLVYRELIRQKKGRMEFALLDETPVAGVLTGWDDHYSYYLAGGRAPGEGLASAHALLLDRAITNACGLHRSFDFEGSMNPGIANFFQSFGAIPDAYLQIRKFNGPGKVWSIFHK